ncbi:hypothetical protein BEP19_15895 [Ammoniphilus oxalaticus]|uniref:DNA-packaging protein n=1 Tax=Ammoniphilus oxalaticus TaxID=66863 RepID=A0A419SQH2_9BACL|nr:head-tail connector protein [Ammoniphilus oxalaticus]RKD26689.1 hypothetical protein BEP19_15895 [Ammoniphilus oxalaticus]
MLDSIKAYLRIDGDQDDGLLSLLIESAKAYLRNAGVDESEKHLYKLAVIMIVTHWYENREQVTGSTPRNLPLGIKSIILQMGLGE